MNAIVQTGEKVTVVPSGTYKLWASSLLNKEEFYSCL